MKYNSYTKSDNYYEFFADNGYKEIIPSSAVILVDDDSNLLSIKLTHTRKTIGIVPKNN